MSYGLKHILSIDPPAGGPFSFKPRYFVHILQKNYSGSPSNITGGDTPVLHRYDTDDPKAPIRGSSLSVNYINDGTLPLRNFYSANDDEYKIRLYWNEKVLLTTVERLLWEGFLVQDDCSEHMVDAKHEVTLTASDNLGLLKDVTIDKAPASYDYFNGGVTILMATAPHLLRIGIGLGNQLQMGDKVQIVGTAIDGTYSIASMVPNGLYMDITTVEPIATLAPTSTQINILRNNLLEKVTLLSVIKRCLSATGLELKTNIYCNIWERMQVHTSSFLDQTLIDAQTLLKDATNYKDCYEALSEIMERFELSFFQAEGVWNIVRWGELRYYANNIPGFSYGSDMNLIGAVTLEDAITAEPDLGGATPSPTIHPIYQLMNRIFRAFQFTKETFNYKQPPQLLRNYDLQQVGSVRNSYSSGGGVTLQSVVEYNAPWWYYTNAFPTAAGSAGAADYFIRVTKDYLSIETERALIVRKNSIHSFKIEANKGDFFTYSFTFRTSQTLPGPTNLVFYVKLTDGTQTKYIKGTSDSEITTWENTVGYTEKIATGDNARDWHTVSIKSAAIPFDGLVYCYLSVLLPVPNETLYKDIRFEFTSLIANSTKVKGHTHTSTQLSNTKNKSDIEIGMDTTTKNSVLGTLFLPTLTGLLQTLTTVWHRGHIPLEQRKLGYLTTFEKLFWRRVPRTILEGSLKGLLHNSDHRHISLLTVMKYNQGANSTLNFVWGKFEIDYKNNMINNSPMWEMYKDGEINTDLVSDYEFKFLYQEK